VEKIDGNATKDEMLAILAKYGIHDAYVELWGTGTPLREFLWSEDMADASVHILEKVDFADLRGTDPEVRNCHINIGSGVEYTIRQTAEMVKSSVGYSGEICWNADKPDGTPRKLCSVEKLHSLGWHHKVSLEEGVARLYAWYIKSVNIL
jgi:GDP-L-fucose synthase